MVDLDKKEMNNVFTIYFLAIPRLAKSIDCTLQYLTRHLRLAGGRLESIIDDSAEGASQRSI